MWVRGCPANLEDGKAGSHLLLLDHALESCKVVKHDAPQRKQELQCLCPRALQHEALKVQQLFTHIALAKAALELQTRQGFKVPALTQVTHHHLCYVPLLNHKLDRGTHRG